MVMPMLKKEIINNECFNIYTIGCQEMKNDGCFIQNLQLSRQNRQWGGGRARGRKRGEGREKDYGVNGFASFFSSFKSFGNLIENKRTELSPLPLFLSFQNCYWKEFGIDSTVPRDTYKEPCAEGTSHTKYKKNSNEKNFLHLKLSFFFIKKPFIWKCPPKSFLLKKGRGNTMKR